MLSLRTRLLISFGLVIALTLLAAGLVSVWLMRDQQAAAAEKRIGRLVDPLARRVLQMELQGLSSARVAEEIAGYARFYEVRILLLDNNNTVTLDTNLTEPLVGQRVAPPTTVQTGGEPSEAFTSARVRLGSDDMFLFAPLTRPTINELLRLPPRAAPPMTATVPDVNLLIAVPAGDVTAAWATLMPRLLMGGGFAAAVGVVLAVLLARRITRPIVQMTEASRAMAHGDYSQRIDADSHDELGELGRAFNEMAQQVDRSRRAMRQLVADVSHDLKTPLTSIQGYTQAMLDGLLEDEQERARAAETVHQEAERMQALVEDLLYLSQIEAGQLPMNMEPLHIDRTVTAAEQRFRYQAEVAGVRLRLALSGGQVVADERRMEQVLANLLDNAIRFAPAGSEVLVRTAQVDGSVLIEVHNGGDEIPAEELPFLFDRFYQVDRARSRGGQVHSGLGLAIVRELVQAHGGDVSVQSAAGAGTVFTVRLPAAPPADGPAGWGAAIARATTTSARATG